MKSKKFLVRILLGTLIIVGIAFGLMLAGCASTGGSQDPAKAAKQLAEDINAIEAGKAVVNGATVTLTGWAGLKTALTVPEGITLDLTADGAALELRDGAVLTVNGTVDATGHGDHGKGWVEGSLRIGNGAAVINGNGTIYLKSKGRLLGIWDGRKLTIDGVTLAGLKDNDASLVEVGEGGELVLKSGKIMGNTRTSGEWADGGGVNVHKGTFTMEGGAITGNTAKGIRGSNGGGVRIGEESVFTMIGGAITGNTATGNERKGEGGGVNVHKGMFTMEGGTISGNTATGDEGASGGGVRVGEESVFIMRGGTISRNTAQGGDWVYGGGVEIAWGASGTFTMEGGEISGNTAQGGNGAAGGGVCFNGNGMFTMTDGTISENIAQGRYGGGAGVAAWGPESMFTMTGGTISGNTTNGGGGGVFVNGENGPFMMTGGTISGNSANDGGGVRVGGGMFTMEGGTISGNSAANGGGVQVYRNWTFIKSGGIIYGSNETRNDADGKPLKNTAANGNAVHMSSSPVKQRGTTAGEDVALDSNKSGSAGGWE
jgi:hypothetical protein